MKRLFLLLVFLLFGCQSLEKPDLTHVAYEPFHEDIAFEGRLSLHYTKAQDEFDTENLRTHSLSLKFSWVQEKEKIAISLFTPLGQTIAQIEVRPHETILKTSKKTYFADNPEELLQHALGFSLPLRDLRFWLQGYENHKKHLNPYVALYKKGWTLFYSKLEAIHENRVFAKKLEMKRKLKGAKLSEIEATLIIDEVAFLELDKV